VSAITLATLGQGPEAKVFDAVIAAIRGDPEDILPTVFNPILALETPTWKAFINYGAYSMAVQPFAIKPKEQPSSRTTIQMTIHVTAYLPVEEKEENSELHGLNLLNHLRKLLYGQTWEDPDTHLPMNVATTVVAQSPAMMPVDGATRLLNYEITVEFDIDPTTGDFI
jgi:hypothetical protein